MNYSFEWDPVKALSNRGKHGVPFERVATVFRDPGQISVPDDEHSDVEDRWATIGLDELGNLLVVIHTFRNVSIDDNRIRIISARKATHHETRQYAE